MATRKGIKSVEGYEIGDLVYSLDYLILKQSLNKPHSITVQNGELIGEIVIIGVLDNEGADYLKIMRPDGDSVYLEQVDLELDNTYYEFRANPEYNYPVIEDSTQGSTIPKTKPFELPKVELPNIPDIPTPKEPEPGQLPKQIPPSNRRDNTPWIIGGAFLLIVLVIIAFAAGYKSDPKAVDVAKKPKTLTSKKG